MTEIRPLAGFEEDYARYVERKAKVEEEVKAEYEKVLAERTSKLDRLIAETSEVVEIAEPVVEENACIGEQVSEGTENEEYVGE